MLIKVLRADTLDGRRWFFHESNFADVCADEEAIEAFDQTFAKKEKCWQASQEEFYIMSHSTIN